uniref:FLYWCH-type domain-containing protein n=1 Tax=Loa loa TaxID=7209 RepID=A0A1I7VM82_LOALO
MSLYHTIYTTINSSINYYYTPFKCKDGKMVVKMKEEEAAHTHASPYITLTTKDTHNAWKRAED